MSDEEELKIPEWLPLNAREESLLEQCTREDVELSEETRKQTRVSLYYKGLIEFAGIAENYIQTYRATAKGIQALRITKIMRRLGMPRQARQVMRYDTRDLSDLLTALQERAKKQDSIGQPNEN